MVHSHLCRRTPAEAVCVHRAARRQRVASLLICCSLIAGCATPASELGFGPVQQAAKERLGQDLQWPRTAAERDRVDQRVAELLAAPLTVDAAVQVALLNNRGLRAGFQELGIGDAERVQAGRLPNPGISVGRLRRDSEVELEWGVHFKLARLLALPMVGRMEAQRFEQIQGRVTMSVLTLAAETRQAWVHALAAEETVRYMRQVKQVADASTELARRMEQVGNFNKLQRAREQAFSADAALNLARAEQWQRGARERLIRLLGVSAEQTQFKLPERLPDLPKETLAWPDVERAALDQRLDVQGARLDAERTAKSLGLTRTTRFVNVLEAGYLRNTSNQAPDQRGWEIRFELPLFDWGDARVARAEAVYLQAVDRAAETAVNARSQVRQAYGAYRSAHDIARHHAEEIVPLRRQIADENLLRYNGMLIGVFELLADARAQIASVNAAIEARRDFWLAQAELDMALIGQPALAGTSAPTMAAEAAAAAH